MKKLHLTVLIVIIASLFMIGGCQRLRSVDNPSDPTVSAGPSSPTMEPTVVPTHTLQELSMDAYEKFMNNESTVCFDLFVQEDDSGEALFKKGSGYTLSEVLDKVTSLYLSYSDNKKIDSMDYSYIDCGKDGVSELALRFNGMDIYEADDDSTLVYIMKYIDGKLTVCFYYETWARSESTMNEYGCYESGGSNGASNYSTAFGLVDKDGIWKPVVSIESESDIYQLAYSKELGQIPIVAETKGITGGMELVTIRFEKNDHAATADDADSEECFYTFYAYDDNGEPIEDPKLYTDSLYQEIFDEASVPFITPDEVSAMISEKEAKAGVTDEISEGADILWKTLGGSRFSEYVER